MRVLVRNKIIRSPDDMDLEEHEMGFWPCCPALSKELHCVNEAG